MGFRPLGVTVVFSAYVIGTLFALVPLGDLSDHIGRRKVLAAGAVSQAASARLPARGSMTAGLPLLLVSLAALESGLFAGHFGRSWPGPSSAAPWWA